MMSLSREQKLIDGACYSTSFKYSIVVAGSEVEPYDSTICYRAQWWGPAASVVNVQLVFSIQRRDVAFSNVNFIRSNCRCV